MKDKENYRELIGDRLEAIHNAETSLKDFPSDEEILRWERLAAARLAERKAKMRKLISVAAVFLLAIAIGAAVIIGPPDVQAGGDGGAVIKDNTETDGMKITVYTSVEDLPNDVKRIFSFVDEKQYNLKVDEIRYTKAFNVMQLEIIYSNDKFGEITLHQIFSEEDTLLECYIPDVENKENWNGKDIYISKDPIDKKLETYSFIYSNTYVCIYCSNNNELSLMKLIEETF